MTADVEVREAFDRLAQAAKDFNTDEGLDEVDADYRLVGAALDGHDALTTQLQAAQATIAEMTEATDASHGSKSERLLNVAMIGSRADLSALAEHDKQVAAKALKDAAIQYPFLSASAGFTMDWLSARAASIEQTEAALMADCVLCGRDNCPGGSECRFTSIYAPVTPTENGENN